MVATWSGPQHLASNQKCIMLRICVIVSQLPSRVRTEHSRQPYRRSALLNVHLLLEYEPLASEALSLTQYLTKNALIVFILPVRLPLR